MRKHRLSATFATSAVAAGAAIGTAMAGGQTATAASAQTLGTDQLVQDFMVANNLLKFEHGAYWHVVDGEMVFTKDAAWTTSSSAPTQHTFSAPAPTHQASASSSNSSVSGGVWAQLRQCESGGNYSTNTGNGYGGAYQFSQSTWSGIGMSGSPSSASPAQQDAAAQKLQASSGWGSWPACSAKLGLR